MKISHLTLFSISILFLFSGCSSSQLRVESTPEGADVSVVLAGQTPRKIGQTPLNLVEKTIGIENTDYQIILSKDGFYPENVLVPSTVFPKNSNIRAQLKEVNTANKALNEKTLQTLASAVAGAQNFLKNKQYELAEQSLSSVMNQFPGVPTLHELMGNIHYLKRDLNKALLSYRKAYELNPSNLDTQRMISRIESMTTNRLPASGGGQ